MARRRATSSVQEAILADTNSSYASTADSASMASATLARSPCRRPTAYRSAAFRCNPSSVYAAVRISSRTLYCAPSCVRANLRLGGSSSETIVGDIGGRRPSHVVVGGRTN